MRSNHAPIRRGFWKCLEKGLGRSLERGLRKVSEKWRRDFQAVERCFKNGCLEGKTTPSPARSAVFMCALELSVLCLVLLIRSKDPDVKNSS